MPKTLDNCYYNKIKLLHELSCILWFIEKHAKTDAKQVQDSHCEQFLQLLSTDLEKHIHKLKELMCACK